MKWYIGFLTIVLVAVVSCKKVNSGSSIPEISLVNVSQTTFSHSSEDKVYIVFRVIDGDANLGTDSSDIFLEDSRDKTVYQLEFPTIPTELQDAGKGINALCTLELNSSYFALREDDTLRVLDTLQFDIQIQDKALNKSNHITTPDIFISK